MPVRRVHLVRHGESTWNVEGRLQGQTPHIPLTDRGVQQAHEAADRLARLVAGSAQVHTSDQLRAEDTAMIIATRLGVDIRPTTALREQGLGDLEGRRTTDLREEPTPVGVDVTEVRWGGGESIADVHRRVTAYLLEALTSDVDDLVLVTHGDTMRVALAVLAGRGHRDVAWDPIANGAIVTVTR